MRQSLFILNYASKGSEPAIIHLTTPDANLNYRLMPPSLNCDVGALQRLCTWPGDEVSVVLRHVPYCRRRANDHKRENDNSANASSSCDRIGFPVFSHVVHHLSV